MAKRHTLVYSEQCKSYMRETDATHVGCSNVSSNAETNEPSTLRKTKLSDWRTGRMVAGCVRYLGDKNIFTDVTFAFPNDGGKKCTGHKLILSMRSTVFEAMFYGTMAETGDQITIEDIEACTFEQVLRFMYTDTIDLNGENVLKCLYAAKKYCLEDVIVRCKIFLEKSISVDNVCSIYEQAKFFDELDLHKKCRIYFVKNASEIFKGHNVVRLSKESLTEVLCDESLSTSELENFETVLRWSDAKCRKMAIAATPEHKRTMLGGILENIRFPLMTLTEFAEHVTPSKVVSDRDMVDLLQFLITRKTTTPGRVAQYVSLPRKAALLSTALGSSNTVSSPNNTMKRNLVTVVLESSHDIEITALKCGQQYNFKSVVVTNAHTGQEIGHTRAQRNTYDDQREELTIDPHITIRKRTKSIVEFGLKSRNDYVSIGKDQQKLTSKGSDEYNKIGIKHEQGEVNIVVYDMPVEVTGIRYTCTRCLDDEIYMSKARSYDEPKEESNVSQGRTDCKYFE